MAHKIVKAAREEATTPKKPLREKGSPLRQSPSPVKESVESPHGQLIREAYFQHVARQRNSLSNATQHSNLAVRQQLSRLEEIERT